MSNLKKYLLVTFTVSWTIGFIEKYSSSTRALCMLIPTLGALAAKADIREMGWNPEFRRNLKYIAFAWLAPTVFQIIGAVFYFLVFPDDFAPAAAFQRFMPDADYAEFRRNGSPYTAFIAEEIIRSLTSLHLLTATVLALGEEIGWRGFMYPKLKEGYGRTKGLLIGGVIHGVWHFPAMILIGFEYGRDYIGAPLLGFIAFCFYTVSMGIVSDFLYIKSGTIWLPAIFHAMINAEASPNMLNGKLHPERSVFGPVDIGLIAALPMAACAAFLLWHQHKCEQMELDELFGGSRDSE